MYSNCLLQLQNLPLGAERSGTLLGKRVGRRIILWSVLIILQIKWEEERITCSIHQAYRLGAQAAKLLLQMINRGECNERDYSLMMRPEIYQGDSIGIISSKKRKKIKSDKAVDFRQKKSVTAAFCIYHFFFRETWRIALHARRKCGRMIENL